MEYFCRSKQTESETLFAYIPRVRAAQPELETRRLDASASSATSIVDEDIARAKSSWRSRKHLGWR
eukprot:9117396-Pyramimonas_sp.AAC.1